MPVQAELDHQKEAERQAKQTRRQAPLIALLLLVPVTVCLFVLTYFAPLDLRFGRASLIVGAAHRGSQSAPYTQIAPNGRWGIISLGPDLSGQKSWVITWRL